MAARGNPNHPVVQEVEDQWYKLCAIVMFKLGASEVEITSSDIQRFADSGRANIVVHPINEVLTLKLVSDREAERLARKAGGLAI